MDTTGDGQRPTATSGSDGRGHLWTEDTLVTRLVLAPGALRLPLRALFSYRTDDPYAVHIVWHLDRTTPVWWVLDRELLARGMTDAVGEGDVRVWPDAERPAVCLSLRSPHGTALVEIAHSALAEWLTRTHELVPPGQEDRFVDTGAELAELLAARDDHGTTGTSGSSGPIGPNGPD